MLEMEKHRQLWRRASFLKEYHFLEFFALLILFRIALDMTYESVISTRFAYMGFFNRASVNWKIVSWIVVLLGNCAVYKAYTNWDNCLSFEILFMLYIMAFVPFTSMIGFGAYEPGYIVANVLYWSFLLLFGMMRLGRMSRRRIVLLGKGRRKLGDAQIVMLSLVFAAVVLYVSGRYARFRLNFDLLAVYEFRAEAASNNLPKVLVYLFSWSRNLNAIIVAYFIRRKKYLWAAFSSLIQLLAFGYDGSKSTFFLLVLAVIISFLPAFSLQALNKWFLRGVAILASVCLIVYMTSGNYLLISLFTRRVFFMPARLAKDYFNFFSENTPDFFRQSFMRFFGFSSPYPNIATMIGREYFGYDMGANNGLIADAMANLGYGGIVIFPALISIVLKLFDRSSKDLDPRIYATVSVYVAMVLTNSFLFVSLLTHGLIVTILLLAAMKRDFGYEIEAVPGENGS